MSRRILYFLVARDRDTNQFKIIRPTKTYGSSLEEIDLYTIQFPDEEGLANTLLRERKTDTDHLDLFIAFQKTEKGEKVLYTKEVIYSPCRRIHDIAEASNQGDIESKKNEITTIFHNFCNRMKQDQLFYDKVLFGETDLYTKFKEHFSDRRFLDSSYLKYKEGGWILKSYPLTRGMIESFYSSREALPEDVKAARKLLEEDLLRVTDKKYDPNQLSLLSFIEEDSLERTLIGYNLLDEKEVDNKDGYQKRKSGEGTH